MLEDRSCLVISIRSYISGGRPAINNFLPRAVYLLCVCKEHDMGIFLPKISCSNVAERENIEMQLLVPRRVRSLGAAKTPNLVMMFYVTALGLVL